MPLSEAAFALPMGLEGCGREGQATLCGADGAPVVVMMGGISGDRFPCLRGDGSPGWWNGLAGPGKAIDPARYRVLGFHFAADEEGRFAPSTADQARVLAAALDAFGIARAALVIGASYGGMISLAFAEQFPERVGRLAVISADASPHPYSTAGRELQRRVVRLGIEQGQGDEALAIARGMAMTSYRSREEFAERFAGGIEGEDPLTCSAPGAYLRARGEAYRQIMSPGRFLSLSASIDRHRCDPAAIATSATLIGATTDLLVPPEQMRDLAAGLAGPVALHLSTSPWGHDMFLKEPEMLAQALAMGRSSD